MSTIQYPIPKAYQHCVRNSICRRTCRTRPINPNVEPSRTQPPQQIDDATQGRFSVPPPPTLEHLNSIRAELDGKIARVEDSIATLRLGEEGKIYSQRQKTADEEAPAPESPKPTLVLMPEDPVPENAFSNGPVSAEVHPLKILRESDKKEEGSGAVAANTRTSQSNAGVQHPTHNPPNVDKANPPLATKTSTSPSPSYYDRIPPFAYGIIPTVVLRARQDPSLPSCDTPSTQGSTTPIPTPSPVAIPTTSKKEPPFELPPAIVAAAERAADRYLHNLHHHPAAILSHKPTKTKEVTFKPIPNIKVFEPPKESSHPRRSSFSLFRKIKTKFSPPKNNLEMIPVEKVTIHAGHTPRPTDPSDGRLTDDLSAMHLDDVNTTARGGSSSWLGRPEGQSYSSSAATTAASSAAATNATYPLRSSPKMSAAPSQTTPALPSEGGDSYFPDARI